MFVSLVILLQLALKPLDVGKYIGARFSDAIGMSVSIPENPVNKLARELNERKAELDEREAEIVKKEQEINQTVVEEVNNDFQIYFIALASGIGFLFILIITNFILDYRRKKKILKKSNAKLF